MPYETGIESIDRIETIPLPEPSRAPAHILAYFVFQPDITAFELAQLLRFAPGVGGEKLTEDIWTELGSSVTRHLQRV